MSEKNLDLDKMFNAGSSGNFKTEPTYKFDWGDVVYYYEETSNIGCPTKLKIITYFGKYNEPNTYLCVNDKAIVYFLAETELKTHDEVMGVKNK